MDKDLANAIKTKLIVEIPNAVDFIGIEERVHLRTLKRHYVVVGKWMPNGQPFEIRSLADYDSLIGEGCVHEFRVAITGNGVLVHCQGWCRQEILLSNDEVIAYARSRNQLAES